MSTVRISGRNAKPTRCFCVLTGSASPSAIVPKTCFFSAASCCLKFQRPPACIGDLWTGGPWAASYPQVLVVPIDYSVPSDRRGHGKGSLRTRANAFCSICACATVLDCITPPRPESSLSCCLLVSRQAARVKLDPNHIRAIPARDAVKLAPSLLRSALSHLAYAAMPVSSHFPHPPGAR